MVKKGVIMDIKIKKCDKPLEELVVEVTIPMRGDFDPKVIVTMEQIVEELKKQGHKIKGVLKRLDLMNISDARRKGIAVLELEIEKPKVQEVKVVDPSRVVQVPTLTKSRKNKKFIKKEEAE